MFSLRRSRHSLVSFVRVRNWRCALNKIHNVCVPCKRSTPFSFHVHCHYHCNVVGVYDVKMCDGRMFRCGSVFFFDFFVLPFALMSLGRLLSHAFVIHLFFLAANLFQFILPPLVVVQLFLFEF